MKLGKTLKKFFKWLGKEELVIGNKQSPSDLITEDEFRRMLNACYNSKDRAILALLYETGARIGEMMRYIFIYMMKTRSETYCCGESKEDFIRVL